MKLTIKQRAVSDLIPYARNARQHSDGQIAQIAASIREFGFLNPVLVDGDNGIIKNKLVRKPDAVIPEGVNEYGMKLAKIG